ncbi:hypothetical protein NL676_004641 [Syzygium grande]|nr:hypothetical protein NL676_004641 [Syzygium grande]
MSPKIDDRRSPRSGLTGFGFSSPLLNPNQSSRFISGCWSTQRIASLIIYPIVSRRIWFLRIWVIVEAPPRVGKVDGC